MKRLVLFSLLWWGVSLAAVPLHAQTSTSLTASDSTPSATPTPHPKATVEDLMIMDQILRPRKVEGYFKENGSLEGKAILVKPLEQLTIPKVDLKSFDVKTMSKRGGVHSGGGDQIGLEFLSALGDSQLDYKQYSYAENDQFLWSDLSQYGATLTVVAVDQLVKENGEKSFRVAENYVAKKTILINRAMWNSITDRRIKNAIALNQVLLMREGKPSGFTERALTSLSGQRLSGMALYDGKSAPLDAKETITSNEHQCLWSFKTLERVAKSAEFDLYSCRYKEKPELLFVRASQVVGLIDRCVSQCSSSADLRTLAGKCSAYRSQYALLVKTAKRINPECAPGGK